MAAPKFTPPQGAGYNRAQTMMARYQSSFDQRWAEAQKAIDEAEAYKVKSWETQASAAAARVKDAQRDVDDAESEKLRLEGMLNTYKSAALGRSVGMLGANQSGGSSSSSSSGSSTKGLVDKTNATSGQPPETQRDLEERAAAIVGQLGGDDDIAKAYILAKSGNASDARDYLMQAADKRQRAVGGKVDPKQSLAALNGTLLALPDEVADVFGTAYDMAAGTYQSAISAGSSSVARRVAAPKFTKAEVEKVQGEDQQHIDSIEARIKEADARVAAARARVSTLTDDYVSTLSALPEYSDRIDRSRMEYGAKFGTVRAPGVVVPELVSRAKATIGVKVKSPPKTIWDHLDELVPENPAQVQKSVPKISESENPPQVSGAGEAIRLDLANRKRREAVTLLPTGFEAPETPAGPTEAQKLLEDAAQQERTAPPAPIPEHKGEAPPETMELPELDMSGSIGSARNRALAAMQRVTSRRGKVTGA